MFEITFLSHPQPRDSGDYLHRILWPGKALAEHVTVRSIQSSHPDYLETIIHTDLLIIIMVVDNDLLSILNKRNCSGRITIYEISDDFEAFPQSLPGYAFYARQDIQQLIRSLASTATAVQFSSSFLHKKYHHLNQNSATFFNQCNHIPPLQRKVPKRKVTIGWAGSTGHRADVERLVTILAHWDQIKNVNFAVMASQTIVDIFKNHHLKVQAEQPGSMQKYLKFLKKIDIGIAMINENDFSLGRSDGKFLEYASRGVIAVCQNRGSYAETVIHGETGFLFDNAASLLEILNQLLQNKTLRQQTRTKAYHYICNDRTHKHGAIKRLKFYQSLIDSAFNPSVLTTHRKKGFKEMIHPIEAQLLRAMLLHRDQHFEEALTIYMSLLEIQPEFHVIWMRLRDLYQTIGSQAQIDLCNTEIDRLTA